jgi:hypothetical protein
LKFDEDSSKLLPETFGNNGEPLTAEFGLTVCDKMEGCISEFCALKDLAFSSGTFSKSNLLGLFTFDVEEEDSHWAPNLSSAPLAFAAPVFTLICNGALELFLPGCCCLIVDVFAAAAAPLAVFTPLLCNEFIIFCTELAFLF